MITSTDARKANGGGSPTHHQGRSLNFTKLGDLDHRKAGKVYAVALGPRHRFSKLIAREIEILAALGVKGDAHCGATVRHLFDIRRDPTEPNLRQVHLLQSELLDALPEGFSLEPGMLGENITTQGIDLPTLPDGTRLHLGSSAVVELTGLRQPCVKLDRLHPGLRRAVTLRRHGEAFMGGSVMAKAVAGGVVRAGDRIEIVLPPEPHQVSRCV